MGSEGRGGCRDKIAIRAVETVMKGEAKARGRLGGVERDGSGDSGLTMVDESPFQMKAQAEDVSDETVGRGVGVERR